MTLTFPPQGWKEAERKKQQGLGRPIISTQFQGKRVVAVGNNVMIGNWKTFVDFLWEYLARSVTLEWFSSEAARPHEKQHPFIEAHRKAVQQANEGTTVYEDIKLLSPSGELACLMDLSYSLYLLQHNVTVQTELIRRLKEKEGFFAAQYEAVVAGILVKAGYALEFEDERDVTRKHCELTATCRTTGKRFSVEVKQRSAGKTHYDVGNQLHSALKKPAKYDRLIFIELNIPSISYHEKDNVADAVEFAIHSRQDRLTVQMRPAPSAYVLVTNHAYQNEQGESSKWAVLTGFQIAGMGTFQGDSIREIYHNRIHHRHVYDILKSIIEHSAIPTTFDGAIPELHFSENQERTLIGQEYQYIGDDGDSHTGILVEVVGVFESTKEAMGIIHTHDGRNMMISIPLTNTQIAAYKHFPRTFFGDIKPEKPDPNDPIALFGWLLNTYKKSSREQLLAFMKSSPKIESYKEMDRSELAEIYCEVLVHQMMRHSKPF